MVPVKTTVSPTGEHIPPRYQRLDVEIWQGALEKHNQRLEGYEAIVGLEIIEHLDPRSLNCFPQMIFGTIRPKIVLITTPNFEFNQKFPRLHDDAGCSHSTSGYKDPTGRTERVFRHSDHKIEMTEQEFRAWTAGAEEWGYTAELGGIGLSNQPSYHDNDPSRPIYATHTAIFRQTGGKPHRSPRSVRSVRLPFMPMSGPKFHAHRLAVRHVHEPRGAGQAYPTMTKKVSSSKPLTPASDDEIRDLVRNVMSAWQDPEVTLDEVWNDERVAGACAGSKRTLVCALGGLGDCPGRSGVVGDQSDEWQVVWSRYTVGGMRIRWKCCPPKQAYYEQEHESDQGVDNGGGDGDDWGLDPRGQEVEVQMTDTSGWPEPVHEFVQDPQPPASVTD